jgi:hypothetical protein
MYVCTYAVCSYVNVLQNIQRVVSLSDSFLKNVISCSFCLQVARAEKGRIFWFSFIFSSHFRRATAALKDLFRNKFSRRKFDQNGSITFGPRHHFWSSVSANVSCRTMGLSAADAATIWSRFYETVSAVIYG